MYSHTSLSLVKITKFGTLFKSINDLYKVVKHLHTHLLEVQKVARRALSGQPQSKQKLSEDDDTYMPTKTTHARLTGIQKEALRKHHRAHPDKILLELM